MVSKVLTPYKDRMSDTRHRSYISPRLIYISYISQIRYFSDLAYSCRQN